MADNEFDVVNILCPGTDTLINKGRTQAGISAGNITGRSNQAGLFSYPTSIAADLTSLMHTPDVMAYNTNAALSWGTGPAWWEGDRWVNFGSGLTYTPA